MSLPNITLVIWITNIIIALKNSNILIIIKQKMFACGSKKKKNQMEPLGICLIHI